MPIVLEGDIRVAPPALPKVRVAPPAPPTVTVLPVVGPTGPPGSGASYEHVQAIAQSVWTVEHNFGSYPVAWSLFDVDGRECGQYVVQHLDLNISRISMDIPTAGVIRLIFA